MLVLTRKIGESVVLYKDVYCTVLGVTGNQVRLGFDAPRRIIINREEIHQRIVNGEPLKTPSLKEQGSLHNSAFKPSKAQFNSQNNASLTH